MSGDFHTGARALILNSHRSRAHRAVVVAVSNIIVSAVNLDKGSDDWLSFDRATGDAIGEKYEWVSGRVPARLVPENDPEGMALRERTETVQSSTEHYNAVVSAAARLKAEGSADALNGLRQSVDLWEDDL